MCHIFPSFAPSIMVFQFLQYTLRNGKRTLNYMNLFNAIDFKSLNIDHNDSNESNVFKKHSPLKEKRKENNKYNRKEYLDRQWQSMILKHRNQLTALSNYVVIFSHDYQILFKSFPRPVERCNRIIWVKSEAPLRCRAIP